MPAALRALRPKQWTKNAIVFAAWLFALGDRSQQVETSAGWITLGTALIFCAVSSAVYLLNDIRDLALDRAHPSKKFRPIAAGELSIAAARGMALVLLAIGLSGAWLIGPALFQVIAGYVVLQLVYMYGLKAIVFVDIITIASGFVLRALAGAVAIDVTISPWLLLCTLMLALFLALCKRRHEKVVLNDTEGQTRPSLRQYDEHLLDQLIAIVGSATVVCYALYTLWPDTVAKFGTQRLGFTIPFVLFGIFRYLYLVYRREEGGRPEQILLTDVPLLVNIALYGLTVIALLLGS